MKKIAILVLISIGYISQANAQVTEDAGLWCTFNLEKALTQKFNLFITEEYRVRENFSQHNLFYTDLGVSFKPVKLLKLSLSYRTIQKFQEENTISFRNRFTFDILLKRKFGKLIFSYRQRLQTEYRNIYTSELGAIPEWYTRSKLTIKYDTDKALSPYISAEYRYQINNPRSVESDKLWHRQRYQVGFDYKKNERNTFGVYYLIQREWNVSAPQYLYILGLEYTISL